MVTFAEAVAAHDRQKQLDGLLQAPGKATALVVAHLSSAADAAMGGFSAATTRPFHTETGQWAVGSSFDRQGHG